MKNNKKYYSIFIIIFFISLFFNFNAVADDKINFLSLKNNVVNLRQGPSFEYPI